MAFIRDRLFAKKDEGDESTLHMIREPGSSQLVDIRRSLSHSLSVRAQKLGRRVSSIRLSNRLCRFCRDLEIQLASNGNPESSYVNNAGLLIRKLEGDWKGDRCPLCQIFAQMFGEAHDWPADPNDIGSIEIRVFPLLPLMAKRTSGKPSLFLGDDASDCFLAAVPSLFTLLPGSENEAWLSSLISKQGCVVCSQSATSPKSRLFTPHLVSPNFNPAIVQEWLRCCKTYHRNCALDQRPQPTLNLIDCVNREVISCSSQATDSAPDYVALSYVWGKNTNASKIATKGSMLPQHLPRVIEDSMSVTVALGFRYLWVDRYCVEQRDSAKKHEQIMHMDSVYQNAVLTIIATAGTDETFGLPGVSIVRPTKQTFFQGENFTLLSTLPSPHDSIAKSRWATRGWTYQEAILSRRRLVFTDDQLYFECDSMSCSESLLVSSDNYYRKPRPTLDSLVRPSMFCLQRPVVSTPPPGKVDRLINFQTYLYCAEQYSKRTLSFDDDALNAFRGIIRHLESVSTFPVRHVWGIPLIHPDDDNLPEDIIQESYYTSSVPPFWKTPFFSHHGSVDDATRSVERVDYLAFMMLGLCWRHDPYRNPPRRRNNLPSWSWVGWEGSVSWPRPSSSSAIRRSNWPWTTIHMEGGSTQRVPELYHKSTRTKQPAQHSKSLHIETSAMTRNAFIFNDASQSLRLSTGGNIKIYPSKQGIDASKVFKRIQSGRYEVISLVTVEDEAYLMLIKWYRRSAYRVGTLVIDDSYLTSPLFTSKVKTFNLR
ncbi:heterokaryon incompatibility protein-domain-containing protein [Hypoxylon sp. NC1633]|nr:heterokaryon incompatibility protein-domain-containing protein [Hypoxylon sp. NC1633]